MELIKGNEKYFTDCVEALLNSKLGENYFQTEGSAKAAIMEGMEADTLFVAIENNEFKGFLYYIPKGAFHSFPYLHLIVTKSSERGKGVGTFMLKALDKLVENSKIFLVVADFNQEGKKFYERNGYVQVGEIASLYRNGITENLMMKEIHNPRH